MDMSGIVGNGRAGLSDGSDSIFRLGKTGEQSVADAHGRYVESVTRGNVYFMSVAAGAPTAYTGAAGGTPLLAVHNPTGSNKNIALIMVSAAPRIVASAIGHTDITIWAGASVVPTGTQTPPKSALTFASGGVGLGFSNTALTGSTALNLALAVNSYFWGTSVAGSPATLSMTDVGGLIVLAPGMQFAIGATVALASLTWDVSCFWEELPI